MDVRLPYPSRRMPVFARGVVATSQPLAAAAGLRMLDEGGTAVDAAVAAAITLTVTEPTGNGIGGDAFALVWDGERLHGLNASGRSPAALRPDRFAGREAMPAHGADTVTVPGAPSAWVALHERFGALPFERLFTAAVRYAEDGFPVSPIIARGWRAAAGAFADRADFAGAFLRDGRAPAAGEIWRQPDQARTLRTIADTRADALYQGELGARLAAHVQDQGGTLQARDLAVHRTDWVEPVSAPYGPVRLHEIPPNGQGLAALIALGILRHTELAELPVDGAEALHLQIEAMKLAFADAHRFVADPAHVGAPVDALLDDAYLAERAGAIDPARAGDPGPGAPARGGTVYLCAADAEGRMVSFIQSNYMGFGSGLVVPGTGITLQNRGAGFTLEPDHPNRVGPGKRPFHTIIPAFVTRGGAPDTAFGVMGGPMQPQGHLQYLLRTVLWGQNPQAAIDAPRWRVVRGREVAIEDGFAPEVLAALRARGHALTATAPEQTFSFGGAQAVQRLPSGAYLGASDFRKDGQAVGL